MKVAMDDWTPADFTSLMCKESVVTQRSYRLGLNTNGTLHFTWSENGSAELTSNSTVAPTITNGSTLWVRVTLDVDNDAVGNDTKFFTSTDGLTWTQLGTTVTKIAPTSIYVSTSSMEIGTFLGGTSSPVRGKVFRAQVLNGINGTVAFDANFENSITSLLQTSFTESSTNGATVTINRSGSTFRSAGVIDAGYLYPGATNTFANSTTDFLSLGPSDSFTLLASFRRWNNNINQRFLGKASSGIIGWSLWQFSGDGRAYLTINDGTTNSQDNTTDELPVGSGVSLFGVRNVSTDTLLATYSPSDTTTTADGTSQSLQSMLQSFKIGSTSEGINYAEMEFIAAAVFRTATLTTKNIADITNYFNGRD
jgi:hypothetical protein